MKTLSSSLDNPNGLSPIQNVMDFDAADSTSLIKITSHKKGRIYRGPNYNAYNRESLGSIPGKQENILVKEGPDGIVGFSSGNSQRFSKESNLSPGPGSYEVNKKVMLPVHYNLFLKLTRMCFKVHIVTSSLISFVP